MLLGKENTLSEREILFFVYFEIRSVIFIIIYAFLKLNAVTLWDYKE